MAVFPPFMSCPRNPDASIVASGPPPIGATNTPPPVDTSTTLAAESTDQRLAAPVARSVRVHAGDRKELIVEDGPGPRGTSQCEASAYDPAKPSCGEHPLSCWFPRSFAALAPSLPAT